MALIVEEVIVIKLSRIVKDKASNVPPAMGNQEMLTTLESVVQELVGDGVIVEATAA
jgi:hypothetical protein